MRRSEIFVSQTVKRATTGRNLGKPTRTPSCGAARGQMAKPGRRGLRLSYSTEVLESASRRFMAIQRHQRSPRRWQSTFSERSPIVGKSKLRLRSTMSRERGNRERGVPANIESLLCPTAMLAHTQYCRQVPRFPFLLRRKTQGEE